jgi:restriction system protein
MNRQSSLLTYDDLFKPIIKALKLLGGSGTTQEIYNKVCELTGYSQQQQSVLHNEGVQTQISCSFDWARTYLKLYGAMENIGHDVWSLTEKGRNLQVIDKREISRVVQRLTKNNSVKPTENYSPRLQGNNLPELTLAHSGTSIPIDSDEWIDRVLCILQKLPPDAFERLCRRILIASGFIHVEIIGRNCNGDIDGIGILKIALLSVKVYFKCKRDRDSIGVWELRNFRDAIAGKTDKGLFITTGTFSSAAKQEAIQGGVPALDLIDGDQLCRILREFKVGVETKTIEVVKINESWFNTL